jgi:hypothetical protein
MLRSHTPIIPNPGAVGSNPIGDANKIKELMRNLATKSGQRPDAGNTLSNSPCFFNRVMGGK